MMRSPSISREVTANKILSGVNTSNNARRRSRGQQQPHERTRKNSRVPIHPVSNYYIMSATVINIARSLPLYNAEI